MCETLKSCVRGCAKVILVLINTIALVAGIALIVVGSLVQTKGTEYLPDVGIDLTPAAVCLIVLGVLLLLIGLFGCFGALTGKHGLLNVYLLLLGIIVVLEIAVLIYGLVNKSEVSEHIEDAITDPFNDVNEKGNDAETLDRATVDSIQEHATCCGITGPDFWTNADFGVGNVPASCCADSEEDATVCAAADAYQDGCLSSSEDLVKKALTVVIVVIVVIILLQVVCMILAWCSKGEYVEVTA